jgi:hypothetical protein
MYYQDTLVHAIFEAVKHQEATSADRWRALIRAGEIARSYSGDGELIERLLGDAFEDHGQNHATGNPFVGNDAHH